MTMNPSQALKSLLATVILAAAQAASLAAAPEVAAEDLRKYNHVRLSREAQFVDATDNGDIAGFRDFKFDCRQQL
jgi:hypothetical protein